jgi:hypothetical protein
MFTPANSIRKFRFCTLAGVAEVHVAGSNRIVGRFQTDLKEFYGPPDRRLIQKFLNLRCDPQSIMEFTRRYGPLEAAPVSGAEFEFYWFDWIQTQKRFCSMWRRTGIFGLDARERSSGTLAFRNGWLTYTAPNLYVYLYMDLVTCEAQRLRICKRADCPHPYFIARHLKQRFCTERCGEWGQREWKKQWWTEHGTAWRAKRNRLKGDKDVAHKAG